MLMDNTNTAAVNIFHSTDFKFNWIWEAALPGLTSLIPTLHHGDQITPVAQHSNI